MARRSLIDVELERRWNEKLQEVEALKASLGELDREAQRSPSTAREEGLRAVATEVVAKYPQAEPPHVPVSVKP